MILAKRLFNREYFFKLDFYIQKKKKKPVRLYKYLTLHTKFDSKRKTDPNKNYKTVKTPG